MVPIKAGRQQPIVVTVRCEPSRHPPPGIGQPLTPAPQPTRGMIIQSGFTVSTPLATARVHRVSATPGTTWLQRAAHHLHRRRRSRASEHKGSGYTHRSFRPDAVRYMHVDTARHRPAVTRPDTWHDKKKTARRAAFPQSGGRFRRWWQVLGSNQRRLSRRFYSPSLLAETHAADQRIRAARRDFGPPPSAMCPCARGRGRRDVRTGTDGVRRTAAPSGPRPVLPPLTCHFSGRLLAVAASPGL